MTPLSTSFTYLPFFPIHLLLPTPHRQWPSCPTTLPPWPSHASASDSHFTLPACSSVSCTSAEQQSEKAETWLPISHNQRSTHVDFSFLRNAETWDLTSCKQSKHLQLILESACLLHPSCLFLPLGPSLKCRNVYSNLGPVIWFLDKTPEFSWKSAQSPNPIPSSELWQLWEKSAVCATGKKLLWHDSIRLAQDSIYLVPF